MTDVQLFLVVVASLLAIATIGELAFSKTSIPDAIWLILAGIVLGPMTGVLERDQLNQLAPFLAPVTLVIVLFNGGVGLRLDDLGKNAGRSLLLSVLTFGGSVIAMTAASQVASLVGILPDEWTLAHGVMLGCILGGSSSVIIMPAMERAKVRPELGTVLNVESTVTDVLCVVGTAAMIDALIGGDADGAKAATAVISSFAIAEGIGLVTGIAWLLVLRPLRNSEHAYPITLAGLFVLYLAIDKAGGSAALGIITVAIILGNANTIGRWLHLPSEMSLDSNVVGFHRLLAFFIKTIFFVFLGAMLGPPWGYVAFGVVLGAVLFAVRIPAAWLATARSALTPTERKQVVVSMPRGMAAGVLATLPVISGVPGTDTLPPMVFAAVLCSIVIFTGGFAWTRQAPSTNAIAIPPASEIVAIEANDAATTSTAPTALDAPATPAAPTTLPVLDAPDDGDG